jgi:DNA-binding NarL/FixJ family response regulator
MRNRTIRGKILIVDDVESIRSLLKRLLERHGYTCALASDVRHGKRILSQEDFDLILCDIQMPGESGLELIRHIASEYPHTAVIIVTVIEDQEMARSVVEMGVYGYILKPFDENQILISVVNALRRRELEGRDRQYNTYLENAVLERTAELTRSNEQLEEKRAELYRQTQELNELNNALKVLLKKREQDKAVLEEKVLFNIKSVISPYLEKLKQSPMNDLQMTHLSLLESNLNDIISSFTRELSSRYLALSPTEIQVAHLIKEGKQTKEISDMLNLSTNTIISHRYKIRSKLGLKNKKVNLRTYLQSLK